MGRPPGLGLLVTIDPDRDERETYLHHVTLGGVQHLDHALPWRGDLDQRLSCVDLDEHLVQLYVVAHRHAPGHDLGVLESLAEVGQQEVPDGHQYFVTRSTAARIRSTLGT